jgi:tetratricopeptide (TPR) repeat protein
VTQGGIVAHKVSGAESTTAGDLNRNRANTMDTAIAPLEDPAAVNTRGVALAAQERYDEAIEQYRRAVTLWMSADSTDRKFALHNWGDALQGKELYEEAAEKYREAIQVDPEFAVAHNDLGRALAAQERYDEAIEQYREANALWTKTSSTDRKFALVNCGDALQAQKLYEEAAQKYREAIQVDPEYAVAYNGLGLAFAAQEHYDEAVEQYRQANALSAKASPTDRKFALVNWGDVLQAQKLYEEAAQKYREAIQVDPEDAVAYNRLGLTLAAQEHHDEAIEQYRQADALWSKASLTDRKFALVNWGDALQAQELYEEAAQKYREAIQVDPEDAVAYNRLGLAFAAQEHYDDAIEQYRQADAQWAKASPTDRKFALVNWGDGLRAQKRYEEAAQKYREAVEVDPGYANAYNGLGLTFAEQEQYDEAIKQYRRADELWAKANSADRKFALVSWGNVLGGRKLYEEAIQKYREAIEVDPEYDAAHNGLGLAFAAQEHYDEAIEQYRRADALLAKASPAERKFVQVFWGDALQAQKLYEEAAQKYREAIQVDPEDAVAYNRLGLAFAAQEHYDDAIEQYRQADARWAKASPTDRKFALWNWAFTLLEQENFEDAIAKLNQAVKVAPKDPDGFAYYGHALGNSWQYREAVAQFEHAVMMAPDRPSYHHSRAHFLFLTGQYTEGWKEWHIARDCYESALREELRTAEDFSCALYFADVLREVFAEYEESKRYYRRVIEVRSDDVEAWTGLAILYQEWAGAEEAPPEIQAQLSYAIHRARELREKEAGPSGQFENLLSLADLHIETRDWAEARGALDRAAAFAVGSRLKGARVATRRGLVSYGFEEYGDAIKHYRWALRVDPGDLTLRSDLGKALLRSKQLSAAREEFARVLRSAPGHIDAILGAAEVCIDMADDGDRDQYRLAEQHLTNAIQHGRNSESGSKRLRPNEVANIYYLRGYAQIKRLEGEAPMAAPLVLLGALNDFRRCKSEDPRHPKAGEAIEKITKRLRTGASEAIAGVLGPIVVFVAGLFVFLFTQLDFFFRETAVRGAFSLPEKSSVTDATTYIALTFGALLFMVAALYLPNLRKLKVPGIELEKASVDRVSAPSTLDIRRFGSLTG